MYDIVNFLKTKNNDAIIIFVIIHSNLNTKCKILRFLTIIYRIGTTLFFFVRSPTSPIINKISSNMRVNIGVQLVTPALISR